MASKEILGYRECRTCGLNTCRYTLDKNGHPFGYCEDCSWQDRVGPQKHKVDKFWANPANANLKRPGDAASQVETAPKKNPPSAPESVTPAPKEKAPPPRKPSLLEQLAGVAA